MARGTFTALVTPFQTDESLDLPAFDRLLERQIAAGVTGLVPCGTTGESPTLSDAEKQALIERCVTVAAGRASVLAGIGVSDTAKSVAQAKSAAAAGADALMLVMPSYNRPSQAGLLRHIERVTQAVDKPFVLYNVPARTAVNLEVETLVQAVERCPNIVGLKDASGHVHYCQAVRRRLGARLDVLCGDDALTVAMMALGATGVISVTSNLLPAAVHAVVQSGLARTISRATELHLALLPVHDAMFCESSPAPIKAAMAHWGLLGDVLRGPLAPASATARAHVTEVVGAFMRTEGAA